jgi:dolichyl-phosphate-mannose-protein mannosyltransferase
MSSKAKNKGIQSPQKGDPPKPKDFGSHGVTDNDIFILPGSDLQVMGALTAVGMAVRLFRIYQPTSVVFDEVQYVCVCPPFWLLLT